MAGGDACRVSGILQAVFLRRVGADNDLKIAVFIDVEFAVVNSADCFAGVAAILRAALDSN